jgi:hypothetical protein
MSTNIDNYDRISTRKPDFLKALSDVDEEIFRAFSQHHWNGSAHEGWAVIFEELDELWDEVRKRSSERDKSAMRREAMQVAATAIRFMVEVCK